MDFEKYFADVRAASVTWGKTIRGLADAEAKMQKDLLAQIERSKTRQANLILAADSLDPDGAEKQDQAGISTTKPKPQRKRPRGRPRTRKNGSKPDWVPGEPIRNAVLTVLMENNRPMSVAEIAERTPQTSRASVQQTINWGRKNELIRAAGQTPSRASLYAAMPQS